MKSAGTAIACVGCGERDTRVVDSRARDNCVYRRRLCQNCGTRFSTAEEPVGETTRTGPGGGVVTRSEEMARTVEAFALAFAGLVEITKRHSGDNT